MRAPKRALDLFAIALVVAIAFFVVPAVTDSGQQAAADAPFQLIYYDGHMHTTRSDGSGSVEDIKATAQARGLSAVIITDHCEDLTLAEWQSLVAETAVVSDGTFLALPGFEITGNEGAFLRSHMNAFNAPDPFVGEDELELCPEEVWPDDPNPYGTGPGVENVKKWVDYIHSQGGIINHNHPSGDTRLEYGANNVEIYNQGHVDDLTAYALGLGIPPADAWGFGISINNFAIYGETSPAPFKSLNELVSFPGIPFQVSLRWALWMATQIIAPPVGQIVGWGSFNPANPQSPGNGDLNSWDELLMAYVNGEVDHPTFGVANSDAHNTADIVNSKVGSAKNGILVEKLNAKEVYKAIKEGRSFATNGPSLAFDVNGEQMGGIAKIYSGQSARLSLKANAETPGYVVAKIDVYKNGQLLTTIPVGSSSYRSTLKDTVTEDGYYRIEVTSLGPGLPQFAYSNPVFVKAK